MFKWKKKMREINTNDLLENERKKKRRMSVDVPSDSESGPPSAKETLEKDKNEMLISSPFELETKGSCLLALPEDYQFLNALHCIVRNNIEVFCATKEDVNAPCPGRKKPVVEGQVGLRCIHCHKAKMESKKYRVKRAVCYPSSVTRIYNSVSDMKFDHFSHCETTPPHIRSVFNKLKDECKKKKDNASSSSSSTNQRYGFSTSRYYTSSAKALGLTDGERGVFFQTRTPTKITPSTTPTSTPPSEPAVPPPTKLPPMPSLSAIGLLCHVASIKSIPEHSIYPHQLPPYPMPSVRPPARSMLNRSYHI